MVPLTLGRHGYPVVNVRQTPSAFVFDTGWIERRPLADEARAGLEAVRSRFTVEARRVGRLYSVWLRVENTGWGSEARWQRVATTPMFQEHVESVSRAIKGEIHTGLRVY